MDKYQEIDPRWPLVGIQDREHYLQRYLVEGRFHANVPADIVHSYHTVEHLIASAYYYWPQYDVALQKLLGIWEMAVKFKCQQLGIALAIAGKSNKKPVSLVLNKLLEKVCALEKDKELQELLQQARALRNYYAHPDRHSFMGGIARQHIISLVNTINLLFLDTQVVVAAKKYLAKLQQEFGLFQQGLFILVWADQRLLVTKALPVAVYPVKEAWLSCWFFLPVLTNSYESLSNHRYSPPILLTFSSWQLQDDVLIGIDQSTQKEVKVALTTSPLHQEKWLHQEKNGSR
ncbi:hypothetical protein [Adhaeribacter pallidiroseus]|uniref:Uncharacterized protein n=1 Tax=Adhaeribacter pallidiroseus TaxID=2072847 RepID=A0A369Q6H7_9BACT|nr:hypothetical protein [Adhaeribacter pallidiroseus]RDC58716.1 hypothetical protein AHMF7616_05350 [Adhaeribacter pallidiroseus]